jgi:tetratricopeptide (TPR) repeat protein
MSSKRGVSRRHMRRLLAIGGFCLYTIFTVWGCTAPAVRQPPRSSPPPPSQRGEKPGEAMPPPQSSPPPASPGVLRPRELPPSPAMVASAQWVEEATQAIDTGDYNRATALLERAISVEPNNGRAFYYYGLAMGERGNPNNALALLRKAEILLRGDGQALAEVYAQMGVNLERLGRQQEAIQRYEQALTQNPSQALARRRLQALKS